MKKIFMIIAITFLIGGEPSYSVNGFVDFAHISRLSDYSIIDIPFRMGSIDFIHQSDNITLNGNFTLEYQLRRDSYFLESKNPNFMYKLALRDAMVGEN